MYMLSFSVVSDSLQQLHCPCHSPGKNTGVGCHFLLQGIFLTQGSNSSLLCLLHQQADSSPLYHLGSLSRTHSLFILILAVLGLHCCGCFSLVAAGGGHSLVAVLCLLIVMTPFIAEHRLQDAWASAVVAHGLQSTGSAAVVHWPAASQHVGYSWPRAQTHVLCIGRWILYHWATREAPLSQFWNSFFLVCSLHLSVIDLSPLSSGSSASDPLSFPINIWYSSFSLGPLCWNIPLFFLPLIFQFTSKISIF